MIRITIAALLGLLLAVPCLSATINPGDNIQAKIDQTPASVATISFAMGTYNGLNQIILRGGHYYDLGNAVFTPAAGKYCFILDPANANNVTVARGNFNMRAIRGEATNQRPTGIIVTGCGFTGQLYDNVGTEHASIWELGWTNSTINANKFTSWGDGGVVGYGGNNLQIVDNFAQDGSEGFHIIGSGYGTVGPITVSRNHFTNMARISVELQANWTHVTVEDNYAGEPNWKTTDPMSVMAYSIATAGSQKSDVHRNYAYSHGSTSSAGRITGIRIGIELGADPKVPGAIDCSENYLDLVQPQSDPVAISISTSTGAKVHDNHVSGGPVLVSFGTAAVITNNGPNVAVDWDINRNYPINGTPIPPIPPTTQPFPVTVVPSDTGAALDWSNPIAGSVHTYTPTDDCGTLTLSAGTTGATLGGLNKGWKYTSDIFGVGTFGTSTFTTTGTSPAGTTSTKATLASTRPTYVPPVDPQTIQSTVTLPSGSKYSGTLSKQ